MELLLRADIPKLGKLGDVVDVAEGYARNYLIPKGLAANVSAASLKMLELDKKRVAKKEQERVSEQEALAERLKTSSITIAAKANEDEQLFGSVGANDIAAALQEEGYPIEPQMVILEEPIKSLGVFFVNLSILPEEEVPVKVWIVGEE